MIAKTLRENTLTNKDDFNFKNFSQILGDHFIASHFKVFPLLHMKKSRTTTNIVFD
jgi:hypothetical protein